MTRLTHPPGAFMRKLQISHARVFAFVEGGRDRAFYDRVLGLAISGTSLDYQVLTAAELPGTTGGKPALVAFYKKLRSIRKLQAADFGKSYVCLFFADKDCDDLLHRRVRSPYFFYTHSYDIEGDLYTCGDLHRAVANACGITVRQAAALIGDQSAWIAAMVLNWKAWTALCMIGQVRRRNVGCTYDRVSDINIDPLAPHDLQRLSDYKTTLASNLGLSEVAITRAHARYERLIEKNVTTGAPLKFFKGKWFAHLIQHYLDAQPKIAGMITSGVGEKVVTALIAQVAVNPICTCCARYVRSIKGLLPLH